MELARRRGAEYVGGDFLLIRFLQIAIGSFHCNKLTMRFYREKNFAAAITAPTTNVINKYTFSRKKLLGEINQRATMALSIKRLEWEHLQKVLMQHDGNISAAARALNMHRRTLQRKLDKNPVRE